MQVVKRNGSREDYNAQEVRAKLNTVISKEDSALIDVDKLIAQCEHEIYDGITTKEVDKMLTMIARSSLELDPAYGRLAANLLLWRIYDEVGENTIESNVTSGIKEGYLDERMASFDFPRLYDAIDDKRDRLFEYMGLEILASRYCMSEPTTGRILETPQMFWMRVAMGLAVAEDNPTERAIEFYEVLSNFYYTPGGRTLFQSGFKKAQMANCFLNTVPDSLDGIFKALGDNAQYLKWSGGTGTDWTPLRSTGAFIKGTGVGSQGIVPFLKIANDVNLAINRSGKRRGAGCVYLETWHLDVEDFLELRKNTGDERRRTHDINTANWIPDLFMKRVRENGQWTLFSPNEVPDLHDAYGLEFEEKYIAYENAADEGRIKLYKRIEAVDLWKKMMGMLFETGHPWILFKDAFNVRNPQDHDGVIHSSNLCTEIGLNTKPDETAVCTLGSINFAKFITNGTFDKDLVGSVVSTSIRMLDNVIDLNYYPTEDARKGSTRHRPVGLGVRGLHDALYQLGIHFESDEAVEFSSYAMEVMAYHAILASSRLAKERGVYSTYAGSKWSRGIFPQDTVKLLSESRLEPIKGMLSSKLDWTPVYEHVKEYGMRNSNTMAIAPTASTANLVGCIPCVEPIFKNIYVKSNKEGEFTVVNKYLVEDLKKLGVWSNALLRELKSRDGSVQHMNLPDDIKKKYKDVFEVDQTWLIKAAAARSVWIDQSQSLNIFFSGVSGKELSDLYFMAWDYGLKSTYYLRTMGASQVEKSTVSTEEFGATHTRTTGPTSEYLAAVEAGEEVGICESCES